MAAAGDAQGSSGAFAAVLYPKVAILVGRHAHNPWLQELPDPVTKIVWDNYAGLSPHAAAALSVESGDLVRIDSADGVSLELPVHVQPGQHSEVVTLALGYGRSGTDRFTNVAPRWLQGRPTVEAGKTIGVRVEELLRFHGGALATDRAPVRITKLRGHRRLACTQDHHRLEVPAHLAPKGAERRDAVRVLPVGYAGAARGGAHHAGEIELWSDDHGAGDERWGLSVDLADCTGCSACVIACQAENNVPVVGRDEVRRHREMSWIRIDRYYEGDGDDVRGHHQPMMCQHCAHAPCETVCPVLATMHSSDGLNQQIYNRCVGTRYCANNCPYKTRRFNWFDYAREDALENMALNPDVTVRSRGVMEKCTMCVQRIQEARLEARRTGRPLADGDIETACQQSCPTRAITFGNWRDPESDLVRRVSGSRAYSVLEEINVRPAVRYLAAASIDGPAPAAPEGRTEHG